jgi:hypothetical protein
MSNPIKEACQNLWFGLQDLKNEKKNGKLLHKCRDTVNKIIIFVARYEYTRKSALGYPVAHHSNTSALIRIFSRNVKSFTCA